jgi:hypothetical protein
MQSEGSEAASVGGLVIRAPAPPPSRHDIVKTRGFPEPLVLGGLNLFRPSHGAYWAKEKAIPKDGPESKIRFFLLSLFLLRPMSRVLHVTGHVVRGTLCLVELPFGLQLLVAHHLAGGVLHRALDFVCGAFHVFAIHVLFLFKGSGDGSTRMTSNGFKRSP